MRRALVLLFVIVAAGIVATVLVQQGFINPSPSDRLPNPEGGPSVSPSVTPTGEPIRTSPRSSATGQAVTQTSVAHQSIDESPCVLDGMVVESSGAAVVGAVVTLAVDLSMPPFTMADGPVHATTSTDDAGRFQFNAIPRGFPWVVNASHQDLAPTRRVLGNLRGRVEPLQIVMGQGTTLRCVVQDGQGAPLAGIPVEVRTERMLESVPPRWVGTTGPQGTVEIQRVSEGIHVVRSASPTWVPAVHSVTTRGDGAVVDVPLTLVRGSPLSGDVVTDDGTPLLEGVCEASTVGSSRSSVTTPIVGGRFAFTALAPGLHVLLARTRDGGASAPVNAVLPHEPSAKAIRLVMPTRGSIELTVTGTDGRPCADAMAWIQAQPDPYTGRPERVTWVGSDQGCVTFGHVRQGRWWAVARSGTGPPVVSEVLDVLGSGVTKATIRLSQGLLLYGVVRDVFGKPIEGVEVRARPQVLKPDERPAPQLPGKAWVGSCRTDAAGKWWLRVVPGPIRLTATHSDFIETTGPVLTLPIAVEAMAPDLTLVAAATLQGHVAASSGGPDPSATISAWMQGAENPTVLSATTNAEGAYIFRGLTPGRWYVKIIRRDGIFLPGSDEPSAAKSVDVSADAPTRVDF